MKKCSSVCRRLTHDWTNRSGFLLYLEINYHDILPTKIKNDQYTTSPVIVWMTVPQVFSCARAVYQSQFKYIHFSNQSAPQQSAFINCNSWQTINFLDITNFSNAKSQAPKAPRARPLTRDCLNESDPFPGWDQRRFITSLETVL